MQRINSYKPPPLPDVFPNDSGQGTGLDMEEKETFEKDPLLVQDALSGIVDPDIESSIPVVSCPIQIEYAPGESAEIVVTSTDDPEELARVFCQEHNLDARFVSHLTIEVQKMQENIRRKEIKRMKERLVKENEVCVHCNDILIFFLT